MLPRSIRTTLIALLAALPLATSFSANAAVERHERRDEQTTKARRSDAKADAADSKTKPDLKVLKGLKPDEQHYAASIVKSDFKVVKDAIEEDRIVPFMKEMASGKTVKLGNEVITFEKLKAAWTDKTDSLWIESEFRQARPHSHEWIPSNYILKVIDRAQSSKEGLAWIDLQDKMRSLTDRIIFNPKKTNVVEKLHGKDYAVLQGHVGALKDHRDNTPLIVGQAGFHDALRHVFDKSSTMQEVVAGMKDVAKDWVWDGSDIGMPIHPQVYYFGKGTKSAADDKGLRTKQAENYKAIQKMFDGILDEVKAAGHAPVAEEPVLKKAANG